MVVSMISMLMGTTVFAYVMSQLLMVVLNLDPSGEEVKRHKSLAKSFIELKNLPSQFKEVSRLNLVYTRCAPPPRRRYCVFTCSYFATPDAAVCFSQSCLLEQF
jgi:hypothetical protein